MSHFTRLKTRMTQREYLIEALQDLGYKPQCGDVEIRGWMGRRARVEIRVPTRSRAYDIGFKKNGAAYEVIADWWGIKEIEQEPFVQQVTQRYACHAARARLQEQGFTLVTEETQADGQLHLLLRRMR